MRERGGERREEREREGVKERGPGRKEGREGVRERGQGERREERE